MVHHYIHTFFEKLPHPLYHIHLDIWVRMGDLAIRPELPHISGADISGVVERVGSLEKDIKEGDGWWWRRASPAELAMSVRAVMTTTADTTIFWALGQRVVMPSM